MTTRRRTVLLIEDSQVARGILRRRLEELGVDVREARDGAEGARAALADPPDLVVTDVDMPILDGFQLARFLKQEAVSRYWGRHTGADAYLVKDAAGEALAEMVERLLAVAPERRPEAREGGITPDEVLSRVARRLDAGLLAATAVNDVLEAALAGLNLEDTARRLLKVVNELVDAPLFALAIIERGSSVVFSLSRRGASSDPLVEAVVTAAMERLGHPADRMPLTLVPAGTTASAVEPSDTPLELSRFRLREAEGVFLLWPAAGRVLRRSSRELLHAMMPHMAVAIDTARLADRLRRLSAIDDLTGVANRRTVLSRLDEETARAIRYRTDFSVVLADIDHFKAVNDRLGHPAGDEVLRTFAGVLGRGLRGSDVLGRYGGEEFLVLLPHCTLGHAVEASERMGALVRESRCAASPEAPPVRVTASFGVASLTEVKPARAANELLALADRRLYEAKEAGRDCVRPVVA